MDHYVADACGFTIFFRYEKITATTPFEVSLQSPKKYYIWFNIIHTCPVLNFTSFFSLPDYIKPPYLLTVRSSFNLRLFADVFCLHSNHIFRFNCPQFHRCILQKHTYHIVPEMMQARLYNFYYYLLFASIIKDSLWKLVNWIPLTFHNLH